MKVKKVKNEELIDRLRQLSIRDKLSKNKSKEKSANSLVKLFGVCVSSSSRSRGLTRSFCVDNESGEDFCSFKQRVLSLTRSNDGELTESLFDNSMCRGTSFSPSSSCYNSTTNNAEDPFSSTAGVLHTSLQNTVFKTGYSNVSRLRRSYATGLNSSSGYSSLNHPKITNSSSAAALSNLSGFSISTMRQLYSLIDYPLVNVINRHATRRASGSVSARNSLPLGPKQHHSRVIVPSNQTKVANGPLFCYTSFSAKEDFDESRNFNQVNNLDSSPFLIVSRNSERNNGDCCSDESHYLPTNTPVDFSSIPEAPALLNTPVRTRRNSDPERWQQHLRRPLDQVPVSLNLRDQQPEMNKPEAIDSAVVSTPVNTPFINGLRSDDFSVDELASYLEYMVHIPGGRMSEMAQRMYL